MDDRLVEEFPVNWEDDDYVTRREFFRFMTLASGGLAVGSGAIAAWTTLSRSERSLDEVKVAAADQIPVGGSIAFEYPRKGDLCLLIHKEPGHFVAYSRRCTHLSCPVDYQPELKRLYCHCHNGAFSLEDGRVLQGPPPRPLPRILIQLRQDGIYAVGIAKGEV